MTRFAVEIFFRVEECVCFVVWHAMAKCPTTYQYSINDMRTIFFVIATIFEVYVPVSVCLGLCMNLTVFRSHSNPCHYIRCTTEHAK